MSQRAVVLRRHLQALCEAWQTRAKNPKASLVVQSAFGICARELADTLAEVEAEITARAVRGWKTRRRNARLRERRESRGEL